MRKATGQDGGFVDKNERHPMDAFHFLVRETGLGTLEFAGAFIKAPLRAANSGFSLCEKPRVKTVAS